MKLASYGAGIVMRGDFARGERRNLKEGLMNTASRRFWRRANPTSLRTRVGLALAVVIFAVAAILGGLIGESSVNQLRARIGQVLATDAARVAERLNTEMGARARELTLLAALDPLRSFANATPVAPVSPPFPQSNDVLRVQSIVSELKRSFPAYVWIGVTDPQGKVIAATDPASVGTDIASRMSSREIQRSRSATPTVEGSEPDVPRLIDVTHPILATDGTVAGLIVAQLPWDWIRSLAGPLLSKDARGNVPGQLFIVSAQDTVLIGPSNTVGQKLPLQVSNRARAGFYGNSVEPWPAIGGFAAGGFLTGASFAAGEGRFPGPGSQEMKWSVLIREKLDTAFAPAYDLRRSILLVGAVLAAVFAVIGWLLAGWITAPLRRIAVAAERLRQGDDIEIPLIRGAAEFASLSGSLRALVATLTRKQVALDEMQDLALHDPLTGLLNRNGMRVHIQRAVAEARAEGSGLLVCVGDLDGFKAVNDTLGHAGGDILLRQVAARFAASIRQDDIVARLGGDEFVLALRAPGGFTDADARAVAERALFAIAAPYEVSGRPVRIGCSLGAAFWPDHADPRAFPSDPTGLSGVLEKADAALYAVKRAAKGRLLMHGETQAA